MKRKNGVGIDQFISLGLTNSLFYCTILSISKETNDRRKIKEGNLSGSQSQEKDGQDVSFFESPEIL